VKGGVWGSWGGEGGGGGPLTMGQGGSKKKDRHGGEAVFQGSQPEVGSFRGRHSEPRGGGAGA